MAMALFEKCFNWQFSQSKSEKVFSKNRFSYFFGCEGLFLRFTIIKDHKLTHRIGKNQKFEKIFTPEKIFLGVNDQKSKSEVTDGTDNGPVWGRGGFWE